jgi:hypothetical protein
LRGALATWQSFVLVVEIATLTALVRNDGFLLYSFGLDNSHILYGTIHIVGNNALYLIHNLQQAQEIATSLKLLAMTIQ